MKKSFYVYILSDPINGIVRYVGCTSNPNIRFKSHISGSKISSNKFEKDKWIYNLIELGLEPIMHIVYETNNVELASEMECFYYKIHNSSEMLCVDPSKKPYNNQISTETEKSIAFCNFVKELIENKSITKRDVFESIYSSKMKISHDSSIVRIDRKLKYKISFNDKEIAGIFKLLASKNIPIKYDLPYISRRILIADLM